MKGICFKEPLFKAVIEGRKTQTRRIVKPQPDGHVNTLDGEVFFDDSHDIFPRYKVGETVCIENTNDIKPVVKYEELYIVTKDGNILTLQENHISNISKYTYLKQRLLRGYCKVGLTKNRKQFDKFVHRIVAEAFIPNPSKLPDIDHINGNKTDNRLENLRWSTTRENCNNPNTKCNINNTGKRDIPVLQYDKDMNFIAEYKTAREAELKTGANYQHISKVCKGKRKHAGGYIWKYGIKNYRYKEVSIRGGNFNDLKNKYFIEITNIRCERLQDISDEDCVSEGICPIWNLSRTFIIGCSNKSDVVIYNSIKEAYTALINKIHGKGTWESNPYVWRYSFKLINKI